MVDYSNSLSEGIRQGICSWIAGSQAVNDAIDDVFPVLQGWTDGVEHLYRSFCNDELPPYVPPTPPFAGGQCVGTTYDLRIDLSFLYRNISTGAVVIGSAPAGTNVTCVGSISSITPNLNAGGIASVAFLVTDRNGTRNVGLASAGTTSWRAEITSAPTYNITRPGGLPDTCGNITIDPPPLPSSEQTINVTYTNNEGDNINVTAYLVLAPVQINPSLQFTMPFRFSFNPSFSPTFSGEANFSTGDITINSTANNYTSSPSDCSPSPDAYQPDPTTPDTPAAEDPGEDVPDPETPETPRRVIKGVIVTVNTINSGRAITEIYQEDNPNVFIPRLGNVQFYCSVGGKAAWTEEIPVKNRRQIISCPWESGALLVRGTPSNGVTWTLSPVYGSVTESVTYFV